MSIYDQFWKQTLKEILKKINPVEKLEYSIDISELSTLGNRDVAGYDGKMITWIGQVRKSTDSAVFKSLKEEISTIGQRVNKIPGELVLTVHNNTTLHVKYTPITYNLLIEKYSDISIERKNKEIYKWQLVKNYQDGWRNYLNGNIDFKSFFTSADFNNLIYGVGITVLKHAAKDEPEAFEKLLLNLYNENLDLEIRVSEFLNEFKKLYFSLEGHGKNAILEERTIATLLTFRYPDKYTFFKDSFYTILCKGLGIKPEKAGKKMIHYYILVADFINNYLSKYPQTIEDNKKLLDSTCYPDPNKLILAQDILYINLNTGEKTFEQDESIDMEKSNDSVLVNEVNISYVKQKNMFPLNQILYGPPGTGKTYKLLQLIKEMDLVKELSQSKPDYNGFVSGYLWWEILAMVLLDNKESSVPQMLNHELVKAKLAISNIQHAPQRLWSTLQNHTVEACTNVKLKIRSGEPVFYKEPGSNWRLDDISEFKEQFPFLVDEWKNFKESGKDLSEQRNFVFTTCHQSLSYEDFIEGIKPVLSGAEKKSDEGAGIQYEIRKGIFYQACESASRLAGYADLNQVLVDNRESRKVKFEKAFLENKIYVLFLDEINRTNVSAVFGELITLIEDDKRLGAVNEIVDTTLPYSQTKFGVPSNLFIVGTMNTADRSVEALDTALRRRFVFEEMMAKPELLSPQNMINSLNFKYSGISKTNENYTKDSDTLGKLLGSNLEIYEDTKDKNSEAEGVEQFEGSSFTGINLQKLLTAINNRLNVLLSKDNTIGHAWLMNVYSLNDLQLAFKNKIYPLLQEYFYNNYAKIGLVLGSKFVEQKSAGKLFAVFKDDEGLVGDYESNIIYTLIDPMGLTLDDFKSIYQ